MHWQARFEAVRTQLLEALGWVAMGGMVEQVAPLGIGGLPGAAFDKSLEIGIATWPFPPEDAVLVKLASLGYVPVTERSGDTTWPFHRPQDGTGLLLAEAGSTAWTEARLLRDFAGASEANCMRIQGAGGNQALMAALVEESSQWWLAELGFAPLYALTAALDGYACRWCVSSGWALDLFLGRPTRVHHDVDLVVDRADQLALRAHLESVGFYLVTPLGGKLEPWPPYMRLELPRHQVHAHRDNDFLDILLTDFPGGFWQYRRDPAVFRRVERAILHTAAGLPYLAPELALLFKSKNTGQGERPQDGHDFDLVRPYLSPEARAWLSWALAATEPDHPWRSVLAG